MHDILFNLWIKQYKPYFYPIFKIAFSVLFISLVAAIIAIWFYGWWWKLLLTTMFASAAFYFVMINIIEDYRLEYLRGDKKVKL